jgi:hypothetical protein
MAVKLRKQKYLSEMLPIQVVMVKETTNAMAVVVITILKLQNLTRETN